MNSIRRFEKAVLGALILGALGGRTAAATSGVELYPDKFTDLTSIPFRFSPFSGTKRNGIDFRLSFQCFRTNLRAQDNPAAPNGCIDVAIKMRNQSPTLVVEFPATFMSPQDVAWTNPACPEEYRIKDKPPTWELWKESVLPDDRWHPGFLFYNLVARTDYVAQVANVTPQGDFSIANFDTRLEWFTVTQTGLGRSSAPYIGHDGPISYELDTVRASSPPLPNVVELKISIPGAAYPGQGGGTGGQEWGFCGGYYSPLMLFTDEKRPQFTAVSHFPLNPAGSPVYWPEAGSPGALLVYDKAGNGKITKADQLFGGGGLSGFENGFDALAALDKNRDNVIDAKDPVYKKLFLWKDKNANGVSEKGELTSLADAGIVSIDLKYQRRSIHEIAQRAELREESTYTYRTKDGKLRKGTVIDVWFAPALAPKKVHVPLAATQPQ